MKKLLVALMLLCGTVHAEEWWEGENKSGGKIVLLFSECTVRPEAKTMLRMYSAHINGQTWWGCWNYWSDQVHVVYDSGESYTYEANLFQKRVSK